ncbi:MAG: hypothetical protein EU518_01775 [Promethearchaeota archaeon]|nr:MAG: hypothetical protein EU518_01775 [Candidatus Lokiarchaeota archaeon]
MPIKLNPLILISPLTYFIDLLNTGLGEVSAFGAFGLIIDFGFLLIFGFGFLLLAFILHALTLQKRFKG